MLLVERAVAQSGLHRAGKLNKLIDGSRSELTRRMQQGCAGAAPSRNIFRGEAPRDEMGLCCACLSPVERAEPRVHSLETCLESVALMAPSRFAGCVVTPRSTYRASSER